MESCVIAGTARSTIEFGNLISDFNQLKKSGERFCLLAKSSTTARVISPFVGKLSQEITATPGKPLSNLATSKSNNLAGKVSKELTSAISA